MGKGAAGRKGARASNIKLEDELNALRMGDLKRMFMEADVNGDGSLDLDEFIDRMGVALGGANPQREKLTLLFRRMDANMDNQVEWDEFSDFMLLEGMANDKREAANVTYICQQRIARPIQRQHTGLIRKIVHDREHGRYYSSATDSTIRVWNKDLVHHRTVHSTGGWVNDIALWSEGSQLAAATTRGITFYDTHSMDKVDFLDPIASPLCLDTWKKKTNATPEAQLYTYGDDAGYVHVLSPAMIRNGTRIRCQVIWSKKLHDDWVNQVTYIPDLKCIASCSNDGTLCLLEESLDANPEDWHVRDMGHVGTPIKIGEGTHARGIRRFVWSEGYKFFATCGIERFIFLFNPYGKQVGQLGPNAASVEDMSINNARNQLVSITADEVCKVWDLTNTKCMQVIDPFFIPQSLLDGAGGAMKRLAQQMQSHDDPVNKKSDERELKIRTVYLDVEGGSLVLGTSAMSVWQMKESIVEEQNCSHVAEVSTAVFNPMMHQVISCDIHSNVSVWNFDSGNLSYTLDNAHEGSKVSAMTVDDNGACLVTGGNDGRVKMWNLSNGKFVKEFVKERPGEVTQLLYYSEGGFSYLIAVGWDHIVTIWADDHTFKERMGGDGTIEHIKPLYQLGADAMGHTDDIRCVAIGRGGECAGSHLLATGADNGEIKIWNLETFSYRHSLTDDEFLQSQNSEFDEKTVERVAFLHKSGLLVSTGGDGYLRIWSGTERVLLRRVSAQHRPGESVLALHASADGNRLLTADSAGFLKQWDVSAFNSPFKMTRGSAKTARVTCKMHFRVAPGAVTDVRFLEIADFGHHIGKQDSQKKNRSNRIRRMSAIATNHRGFILSSSADGDVRLWLAETGALVGNFKKHQNWNLHDPDTYKSSQNRIVTPALLQEEDKRNTLHKWPATGASAKAFLPPDGPTMLPRRPATERGATRGRTATTRGATRGGVTTAGSVTTQSIASEASVSSLSSIGGASSVSLSSKITLQSLIDRGRRYGVPTSSLASTSRFTQQQNLRQLRQRQQGLPPVHLRSRPSTAVAATSHPLWKPLGAVDMCQPRVPTPPTQHTARHGGAGSLFGGGSGQSRNSEVAALRAAALAQSNSGPPRFASTPRGRYERLAVVGDVDLDLMQRVTKLKRSQHLLNLDFAGEDRDSFFNRSTPRGRTTARF
jgi:WD40 repeat protein